MVMAGAYREQPMTDMRKSPQTVRSAKGTPLLTRLAVHTTLSPSGCWEWTGATSNGGYGRIQIDGTTQYVHRVAIEIVTGDSIPDSQTVDHLCRNRSCWNPTHLEVVSRRVNTRRSPFTVASINASKLSCPAGHPYEGSNLIIHAGRRICRSCRDQRNRAYRTRV